ncbi:transcription initiation factor IIF subunit alpha [Arthroderma uncinatum]|uniref:transcription initiation factor IIF subunit alpha n=1 Tax=Arthroderma uncinatum TaxID=74035 RepID=UPI00144A5B1C|nr:transcription initiation factor IIF subunit alpha [Arthroderma uncinatum]KAF3480998.1 transcription initiation factor IIF subunit alpha [Arthroderma uncinatum]
MSSTPPNPPLGRTPPGGPNGPFMVRRRPKPADPLVRPKKRPIPRPMVPGQNHGQGQGLGLGQARPSTTNGTSTLPIQPPRPQTSAPSQPKPIPSADDLTTNGFSGPLLSETYSDYPLVTTKRALREGLRHHIAKLVSKKSVDPRDESQFTRPVRLQRRDPRATASTTPAANDKEGENGRKGYRDPNHGLNEAEREELEAKKEARAKEREDNLAQIAPSASSGPKKTNAPKQRTQQVFKSIVTPEEAAKSQIKYEEALPWHLEDFDNKNIWVGKYEAAMSETYATFVLESSGKMRMIPVDKWYKFTAKHQFKALTIEEAEKHMAKKIRDPRWFMEKEQARAQERELQQYARQRKIYTGQTRTAPATDRFEGDDMDFDEDRFADDEEHVGLFDEDEDAKTAEKRIKQDQLKANIFDLKEEKDYDEEEHQEKKHKEDLKSFGKQVRKALQRREKNFDYSSGSDANPYSDEESTDESELERQREEQKKLDEDPKRKENQSDKPSGSSTKGTNTPSGRHKHSDPLKRAQAAARKRPGSPNLSDASGTDTSRKKPKNKHLSTQLSTSQPASRPISPAPQGQRKVSGANNANDGSSTGQAAAGAKKRIRNGPARAGSASDVERAAASGAEMSDGTLSKRLKLNMQGVKSKAGTPMGSRAGSPTPAGKAMGGSRASSPESNRVLTYLGISTPLGSGSRRGSVSGTNVAAGAPPASFPTATEIHAAIPATGILSNDLLRMFRSRLGNSRDNHRRFIGIVKNVSVFGKEDKLLRPGVVKEL